MNENQLVKIIAFGPVVFIPLMTLLILGFIIKSDKEDLKVAVASLESELIISEKKAIKTKVDSVVDLISYQNSIIEQDLHAKIRERVETAHAMAFSLYTTYKDTKTVSELQNIIITALRPLLWNDGESFIWILDHKGVFFLVPEYLRHLEGSSIINFKDATGRLVIQEEIAMVKKDGEGFLWDTFTKPNGDPTIEYKQLAFVKDFGAFDWYFGSSEYLDTATKISDAKLLKSIDKISKDTSNYLYVITLDGNVILHPQFKATDSPTKELQAVLALHTQALQEKDEAFISYEWFNPEAKIWEQKYTYIHKIPNSNWILGSGFYASTIQEVAAQQTQKLYGDFNTKKMYILSIGTFLLALLFLVALMLSRYIQRSFTRYHGIIEAKQSELSELNQTLEKKVQERTQELEVSKEALEKLATTDSLTDIHNRYSIMKILEHEMSRSKRDALSLCLLLYDVDHFKRVNDTYGHDVGDAILVELTQVVQEGLREIDAIGRYGGEEFLVVMPNTTQEQAIHVAQRVRQRVEAHSFVVVSEPITISLGLTLYVAGTSKIELFKRVDELLYEAKREGRNRVKY